MSLSDADVMTALKGVIDPNTGKDLVTGKAVKNVRVDGDQITVEIQLGYPAKSQHEMIRKLVQRHVAITSTLVIFETFAPDRPPLQDRVLRALSLPSRTDYLEARTDDHGVATVYWRPEWDVSKPSQTVKARLVTSDGIQSQAVIFNGNLSIASRVAVGTPSFKK